MLSRINQITRIDTYFFNIHPNIALPSKRRPNSLFPVCVPVNILKALLPSSILATLPAHNNYY